MTQLLIMECEKGLRMGLIQIRSFPENMINFTEQRVKELRDEVIELERILEKTSRGGSDE